MQHALAPHAHAAPSLGDRIRRRFVIAIAILLAAPLQGCGDKTAEEHELKTTKLESRPTGDAIPVPEPLEDGFRWRGTIESYTEHTMTRAGGGDGDAKQLLTGSATIKYHQTHRAGPPGHVEFVTDYVQVSNQNGDQPRARGTCVGKMPLDGAGHPRTDAVELTGRRSHETRTLIDTMVTAGLLGSRTWLPGRPIRSGESWPARDVVHMPDMRRALKLDRGPSIEFPDPTLEGSVRLEAVRKEGDAKVLVLRVDILIEVRGTVRSGKDTTKMNMGYRIRGTAELDAKTGLARKVEVTSEIDTRTPSPGGDSRLNATVRINATGGA